MTDSEDEFTQKSINCNTGNQFPDVTTLLEYRNNLEMSFNENGGLHVVEALETVQIMKDLVTGLMLEQMNLFLLLAPSMH